MLLISFYGLTRSSFLSIANVADVHTCHNKVEGGALARFFPTDCATYYTIWVSNIKTNKHKFEGGYIRVPNYKSAITELLEVERPEEDTRLFRFWNCDRLLKLLRNYASLSNIIVLGYRFDIHALKNGGVVAAVESNLETSAIRSMAKWVPDSAMIDHYGAMLPPAIKKLVKEVSVDEIKKLKCHKAKRAVALSPAAKERAVALQKVTIVPETQLGEYKPPFVERASVIGITVQMNFPDEPEDESLQGVALACQMRCAVCKSEEGIYAPVQCRECAEMVHRSCSHYGVCLECRRPKKRKGVLEVAAAAVDAHRPKEQEHGASASQAILLSDVGQTEVATRHDAQDADADGANLFHGPQNEGGDLLPEENVIRPASLLVVGAETEDATQGGVLLAGRESATSSSQQLGAAARQDPPEPPARRFADMNGGIPFVRKKWWNF